MPKQVRIMPEVIIDFKVLDCVESLANQKIVTINVNQGCC